MFNIGYKKEAIERYNKKVLEIKRLDEILINISQNLYEERLNLRDELLDVVNYINLISNKPKEMETEVTDVEYNLSQYNEILETMEKTIKDAQNIEFKHASGALAGAAAGAGVAAFAPSAAMAIATTFGTASTGTAISALSGAAATNAALAWLGGGALVAGGGGMSAGSALLALAGPVGWTIGGISLVTSGLFASSKNKKIAHEANQKAIELEKGIKQKDTIILEIKSLINIIRSQTVDLKSRVRFCLNNLSRNYEELNDKEVLLLGTLVNNALSATKLLTRVIGN